MAVDVGVCGMPDPVGFLALACLALAAHSGGCSLPPHLLARLSHAACHSPSTRWESRRLEKVRIRTRNKRRCMHLDGKRAWNHSTSHGSRGLKFRPTLKAHTHVSWRGGKESIHDFFSVAVFGPYYQTNWQACKVLGSGSGDVDSGHSSPRAGQFPSLLEPGTCPAGSCC